MGAGSCRKSVLVDHGSGMKDGAAQLSDARETDDGGASDLRLDLPGRSDAPVFDVGFDIVFGPGPDGGADEPHDAGCDAGCDAGMVINPANCSCMFVIVIA